MTTAVHLFASFIHGHDTLQLVRRNRATGEETVIRDIPGARQVIDEHVWHGADLIIREIPKESTE